MNNSRLAARGLRLGYDRRTVVDGLDIAIPDDGFTVIIGPNACGKSTLLRALSRLLRPESGVISLDAKDIRDYPVKEVARRLALLPQAIELPDGISVVDLVARGRYPHQSLLRQWSPGDAEAVDAAMRATGVAEFADRGIHELSGGQRQRVLLAMVLAQQTGLLLLDEPTTFLDLSHQIEVLELCRSLHRDNGHTVVAVLHDINQAARYATHLVVMKDGRVVAEGAPQELVTEGLLRDVFGLRVRIIDDPVTGSPLVVPLAGPDAVVS